MEIVMLHHDTHDGGQFCVGVGTASGWVLVDCGTTLAQVQAVLGAAPLEAIIITHAHRDHVWGLAAVLTAYPQCRCYLTPATLALLTVVSDRATDPLVRVLAQRAVLVDDHACWSLPGGLRRWRVGLHPSGHLVGAVGVSVFPPDQAPLVISGDRGAVAQQVPRPPAVPDHQPPQVLVLHATSHGATRSQAHQHGAALQQAITAACHHGHCVVIGPTLGLVHEVLARVESGRPLYTDRYSASVQQIFARYGARTSWPCPQVIDHNQAAHAALAGPPGVFVVSGGWLGSFLAQSATPATTILVPHWYDCGPTRATVEVFHPVMHASSEELVHYVHTLDPHTVLCVGRMLIDPATSRPLEVRGAICVPDPGVRMRQVGGAWRGNPADLTLPDTVRFDGQQAMVPATRGVPHSLARVLIKHNWPLGRQRQRPPVQQTVQTLLPAAWGPATVLGMTQTVVVRPPLPPDELSDVDAVATQVRHALGAWHLDVQYHRLARWVCRWPQQRDLVVAGDPRRVDLLAALAADPPAVTAPFEIVQHDQHQVTLRSPFPHILQQQWQRHARRYRQTVVIAARPHQAATQYLHATLHPAPAPPFVFVVVPDRWLVVVPAGVGDAAGCAALTHTTGWQVATVDPTWIDASLDWYPWMQRHDAARRAT